MENIVPYLEKIDVLSNQEYNTAQGDEDGRSTFDRGRNERNSGRSLDVDGENEKQKVARGSKENYGRYEELARKSAKSDGELTTTERKLKSEINDVTGLNVIFSSEDLDFNGGNSLLNSNEIFVASGLSDIDQRHIAYHEVMENAIRYDNDLRIKYLKPAIQDIINDENFKQVRKEFIGDEFNLNDSTDYMIAKDILFEKIYRWKLYIV